MPTRWRFEGEIAGVGSSSGVRIVVGRWRRSPLGSFADVMLERPDGHRVLLAPSAAVADFVAATYRFDEIQVVPVDVQVRLSGRTDDAGTPDQGPRSSRVMNPGDRTGRRWRVAAGELEMAFEVGGRTPLGWALSAVPRPLAASGAWAMLVDPVARIALGGVRTRGTAGNGRREWYGATDVRAVTALHGSYAGVPLGRLRPVTPPVRFGFGSTPARPSVTSVVTTVELEVT